jgi:hypothetical protein
MTHLNVCQSCGLGFDASALHRRFSKQRCASCQRQQWKAAERAIGARTAMKAVAYAVRNGRMQPATAFACTDCAASAEVYDHRDYSKQLQVEPVCLRCNARRGPAFWSLQTKASRGFRLRPKQLDLYAM